MRMQTWAALSAALLVLVPLTARAQKTIYDDQPARGWANYSWATNALDNSVPVHSGTHSIRVSVAAGSYGALEMRTAPFAAAQYRALTFWINGGSAGGQHTLVVKASVGGKQKGMAAIPTLKADTWQYVTVPLAALGVADAPDLTGFLIQDNSKDPLPAFYVDDIQLTAAPAAPPVPAGPAHPLAYTGVSLSGGEFGKAKNALYGKSFTYPTPAEMDYFASKGVNIIRLPFHWEVLQPKLSAPLDPTEFARFQTVVNAATAKGLTVILDPHNSARYNGQIVGTADVPATAFADFWGRLAAPFAQNPRVWFGLMNEPHDMPSAQWLGAANAAIASIRKAGAKNLILVPGNNWTGAHSWVGSGPDANSTVMLGVQDPTNHYIYEVHQYFDADSSGTKPTVVSPTIGVERLTKFTDWCRAHHAQAFLGEIGAADSPEAAQTTENTLAYMEKNRDVWTGFTWWAAGPWWGNYMFTLEPKDGQDRPQMAVLRPHFQVNATMPPQK
ncbi:MAG: glycoside hydrolase family 5 protein [Armatimonadota bacterium]|nr:glycoside hydrolase family 5 protein [Armatimonadota bacterium]